MIITAHQPSYLPWLGYLHKISISDVYVYLDSVQLATQGKENFVRRNKIKTPTGSQWLTIPSNSSHKTIIYDVAIDNSINWQKDHWRAIELNYKKSKYFSKYSKIIKPYYLNKFDKLSDICKLMLVEFFLPIFDISTKIISSSELNLTNKGSGLILEICQKLKCSLYISGPLGKNYLDSKKFRDNGITIYYQEYRHPTYNQLWGSFIPYMSALDLIFNEGPNAKTIMRKKNISKYKLVRKYIN